jgi:hypothetical protein
VSLSLTYSLLPSFLLSPLMDSAISAAEAAELFDLLLMSPDEMVSLPPHLFPAADRLTLWALDLEGQPRH